VSYPHTALIIQWLSGRKVQFEQEGQWHPMEPASAVKKMPHFYADRQYRLAPMVMRYRLGLVKDMVVACNNLAEEKAAADSAGFRGWLTDWTEATV
jgi:hypothetical protein